MFTLISPNIDIDFVGKRRLWLGASFVAILATIVLFFTKGLNYGIDFAGGAEVQISLPQTWNTGKLRETLHAGGLEGVRVQEMQSPEPDSNRNEFLIRAPGDGEGLGKLSDRINGLLSGAMASGETFEVDRVDVVGPAAGSELKKRGLQACFFALLVILVYVTIRFDSRYAPGAIIALFHDSLICIGVFILTQRQFDLSILAAILALIGYSNNDTIIVYDRVRETLHHHPDWSIEKAVNRAINETLGRTLVTSITTFLVVFSLWKFGGSVLENFAFTLMVGVVIGTYSSIFIASNIIIMLTHYQKNKEIKARSGGSGNKRKYQVRPEPKLQ